MALKREGETMYGDETQQCVLFAELSLSLRNWSISLKMVLSFTDCIALISTPMD